MMTLSFVNSFQSEWLKKKRSLASWLVITGAFFTPTIIIIARIVNYKTLAVVYSDPLFWEKLWKSSWESMAIFLLPVGAIMATSLIAQLEYKNNAWKQVHTLPLTLTTIFFSKLLVILVMMVQFFILFNLAMYLSAVIPALVVPEVPFPSQSIPWTFIARENFFYFIDCLPIVALQYLLSLKYKNFLVPMGAGFLLWILALGTLVWKYGYAIPYTYLMFNYLKAEPTTKALKPIFNFHLLALGYFVVITAVSYVMYVRKKDKG